MLYDYNYEFSNEKLSPIIDVRTMFMRAICELMDVFVKNGPNPYMLKLHKINMLKEMGCHDEVRKEISGLALEMSWEEIHALIHELAESYMSDGNYEGAEELLHLMLGADPPPESLGRAYFLLFLALYGQEKYEDAKEFFKKALAYGSEDALDLARDIYGEYPGEGR